MKLLTGVCTRVFSTRLRCRCAVYFIQYESDLGYHQSQSRPLSCMFVHIYIYIYNIYMSAYLYLFVFLHLFIYISLGTSTLPLLSIDGGPGKVEVLINSHHPKKQNKQACNSYCIRLVFSGNMPGQSQPCS